MLKIKSIKKLTVTISAIILLTACGSNADPAQVSVVSASEDTSFQKQVLKAINDTSKNPVYIEAENDFDRDGKTEAFVVTVSADDSGENDEFCSGSLYYVSSDLAVTRLEGNMPVVYDKSGHDTPYYHILKYSDQDLFVFDECGGSDINSLIYAVSGNKAVSATDKDLYIALQNADDEHEIQATVTDFDASTDEDGNEAGGRTEKTYWFYYSAGKIFEYAGREMSLSDLEKADGADAIISNSCKGGWEITNALYRENGIININYRHLNEDGSCDNKYDTLRATYDAQHHIASVKIDSSEDPTDNSGIYRERSY